MNRVFIVGCGDIGFRVARLWRGDGVPVSGLVRSSQSARRLGDLGIITPVQGDLDDPSTFAVIPTQSDLVYYLAPPPNRGDTDPRMLAFVDHIPPGEEPEKVVYMSTTAVYGDLRGEWATEETPPTPGTARGKRRLDAENTILAWGRAKNVPVVILRVAGIYVSDGQPGTITRYYYAVADRLGLPRPPTVTMAEARKVMSEGMLSYLAESKRLDNSKMREELGVEPLYPDLDSGLASCSRE